MQQRAVGKRTRTQARYGTTPVQRKGSPGGSDEAVQAAADRGTSTSAGPLPHKESMEAAFGMPLDSVKAHVGGEAASASASMGADAYTSGDSIVFGASPSKSLVAHELTHVVQQRAGAVPDGMVGHAGDAFEREADQVAATVAHGGTTDVAQQYGASSGGGAVQRKAVQRYESGEHAILGAGAGYPAGGDQVTLPNGAQVYLGEVVAFGDFYADMTQLSQAPRQEVEALAGVCRLEAIWVQAGLAKRRLAGASGNAVTGQVAAGAPGGTAVPGSTAGGNAAGQPAGDHPHAASGGPNADRLKHVNFDTLEQTGGIWDDPNAAVGGQLLGQLRQSIHDQFNPAWAFYGITLPLTQHPSTGMAMVRATVGRRRFRSGASTNASNTGENNALPPPGDPQNAVGMEGRNAAVNPGHLGGDYLDLAQNNLSHFTTNNWANWSALHDRACTEHAHATTEQARQMALVTDMLGGHFLTDRFSTGHFVNKAELMSYASGMMLTQAQAHNQPGDNAHEQLSSELSSAISACLEDDNVYGQWGVGVAQAREDGVIGEREAALLNTLPRGVLADQLVGVIMDMPWRRYDAGAAPADDGNSRNVGENAQPRATADPANGDYHLGAGNLAALQVHDAINRIGFTCRNGAGNQWRVQGDNQVNAETITIAQQAVSASQDQVRRGAANQEAIKRFLPSEGWMDPSWIDDFFMGEWGTAQFDASRIAQLRGYVSGRRIPIGIDGGHSGISPEMTEICHQVMQILFLQPTGATATQGSNNTGLNLSMLKTFLIRRLPEMVSMAYLATSAADLPQEALEAYAPRTEDGNVLPRSANDFVWNGNSLSFNVNVTGCAEGTYHMVAHVFNRDAGYDVNARGQAYGRGNADPSGGLLRGMTGAADGATNGSVRNSDEFIADVPFQVNVPSTAGAQDRAVLAAHIDIPTQGLFSDDGDRYATVSGDPGGQCIIGRSNVATDGALPGNPSVARAPLPRVTGADAQQPAPERHATGIKDGTFRWDNNTVIFAVELDQTVSVDTRITVYIQTMDWDLIGSDARVGAAQAVTAMAFGGLDYTRAIVFTPSEDNWNDTYIQVFSDSGCTHKIGESRSQGHNQGQTLTEVQGHNPAQSVSGMQWNGDVLTFRVTPANSDEVYVKFYDKDWGYDYDTSGRSLGGPANTDPQVGGIHPVSVENGIGSVGSDGDEDTYAIIYQDAACTTPLGRSGAHGD